MSPREQLYRQAEFDSSTQDEAWRACALELLRLGLVSLLEVDRRRTRCLCPVEGVGAHVPTRAVILTVSRADPVTSFSFIVRCAVTCVVHFLAQVKGCC